MVNPPAKNLQQDYSKPDAFFRWSGEKTDTGWVPLADVLEKLQALNPSLYLEEDDGYLFFDQSKATSVFEIVLPEPASDLMMYGISESCRDCFTMSTRFGEKQLGAHHFERTKAGNLLVRPASRHWTCESVRFSQAYQSIYDVARSLDDIVQRGRVQRAWKIFRGSDQVEMWEVDFAYLPYEYEMDTPPIGTISYACEGDLSLETHIERARAIVAAGSHFAIVGDLERLEHRVYRLDGLKIETDKFTLPEMPWFDVPTIWPRDDS